MLGVREWKCQAIRSTELLQSPLLVHKGGPGLAFSFDSFESKTPQKSVMFTDFIVP